MTHDVQSVQLSTGRAIAYCTAESYDFNLLIVSLEKRGKLVKYRDLLQLLFDREGEKNICYFPYGAIVFWGHTLEEEVQELQFLKQFENQSLSQPIGEEISFSYGNHFKIIFDEFILPSEDVGFKLAISLGMAQSVKLHMYETSIRNTIDKTRHLPLDLAEKGKISLSRKAISKQMGELFIERSSINLHANFLGVHEVIWEDSELEPFYNRTYAHFDIAKRVDVVNRRLEILAELFEILGDQLDHRHSASLEWIIIWLIVSEVILTLLIEVFQWI